MLLSSQVFEQYIGIYEPKAPSFRVFHRRGVTRINFTWQLVKFGPITVEIKLVKPIKFIEDITCPRVDMNFIFEWSTRHLTSERSERVRYRVDHEKIKFISISGHVMFCLLYKHQWNTKPFYFNIFNGLKVERVVTKHGRSTWTKTKFIW